MSTVNMEAMMAELKASEVLAQIRLEEINELQEQIKSRRETASGYALAILQE